MKYKLIAPAEGDSPLSQVLLNRGVSRYDLARYINASDDDINEPDLLGLDKLRDAARMVVKHIGDKTLIIVDPDVDGNTSAALLANYLHDAVPSWTPNIDFYFHDGKQHGLNDCIEYILDIKKEYKFVICPDAGSNDAVECASLQGNGIDVLILDHHDFDKENPYAVIINNQYGYSDYPNKALSGVGVVWQFCRYLDSIMENDYASKYLDLVAIGLTADMMDIRSIETRVLIQKGLADFRNPFIYYMAQKNAFKLGEKITPIGAAFYIVPLLNAIQRSGTLEEKKLVFNSMLTYKALEKVPSTKRGHKAGDMETLVEQAVRTCTNVKNRQTRIQDAAVASLEAKIENEHLLDNKVLLILLEENSDIPAEVRGLIANKFMAKYQRPCCILTKAEEYSGQTLEGYRYETVYAGSARGCSLAGVDDFKQLCLDTGCIDYAIGHPNAFGLKIYERDLPQFIEKTNTALIDMSDEAIYYVDYVFQGNQVDSKVILDIANMDEYWGTELDEALVAIENLKVTADMVDIYRKMTNTIKISLPNGVSIMKFNADEELCDKLTKNNTGYMAMDIVGKCNKNEWMGQVTPQIFIEDFNITDSNKYYF